MGAAWTVCSVCRARTASANGALWKWFAAAVPQHAAAALLPCALPPSAPREDTTPLNGLNQGNVQGGVYWNNTPPPPVMHDSISFAAGSTLFLFPLVAHMPKPIQQEPISLHRYRRLGESATLLLLSTWLLGLHPGPSTAVQKCLPVTGYRRTTLQRGQQPSSAFGSYM